MTADPQFPVERVAFFDDLDRQRSRRATGLALCLAAGLAIFAFATGRAPEAPLPGAVAQYAGDLCLVFALALALTTPWTKGQREAMWRKRLYRLRRRAADVARVS